MDVFLVPVTADRYELYCEVPDEPPDADAEPKAGKFRRLKRRFSLLLAEAEHERRHERAVPDDSRWLSRVRARVMRRVAEAVAEQRLLWHLRRQSAATLFFPDDVGEATAVALVRRQLGRDFDRHRNWLAFHSLAFVASGVFFFVPGPNVVAYYFAFRIVGHYLSLRGAKHGLRTVSWTYGASAPLTALRRAIALGPDARGKRVQELAGELRLEHLPRFVERTAVYFSS